MQIDHIMIIFKKIFLVNIHRLFSKNEVLVVIVEHIIVIYHLQMFLLFQVTILERETP